MMYDDLYGDEFDDDEFGISQNRVQRLLKRKAKLEAMMAVSSPGKQRRIARRLNRINNILERSGYSQQAAAGNLAAAAAGIEGIGGLQF
jgi:hypothetical protein